MLIKLKRTRQNLQSTIGEFSVDGGPVSHVCLEDAFHMVKQPGGTRIPAGTYRVSLQTVGVLHARYLKRFGADFHKGMLHIEDVPNFEGIMVHIGNTILDTDGCPLIGTAVVQHVGDEPFEISGSEKAYREFYPPARDAIVRGEPVSIQVEDP